MIIRIIIIIIKITYSNKKIYRININGANKSADDKSNNDDNSNDNDNDNDKMKKTDGLN